MNWLQKLFAGELIEALEEDKLILKQKADRLCQEKADLKKDCEARVSSLEDDITRLQSELAAKKVIRRATKKNTDEA